MHSAGQLSTLLSALLLVHVVPSHEFFFPFVASFFPFVDSRLSTVTAAFMSLQKQVSLCHPGGCGDSLVQKAASMGQSELRCVRKHWLVIACNDFSPGVKSLIYVERTEGRYDCPYPVSAGW